MALFSAAAGVLWVISCGAGPGAEGTIGPSGGQLCQPADAVCVSVPPGALEAQAVLRILPGAKVPAGALSEGFDIGSIDGRPITFGKPATVSFSLDVVKTDGLPSENLLRIYTFEDGEWRPLENAFVDRVQNRVLGDTRHLSPFVVLRSDRLPDGGLPIEIDGGERDASIIVVPPFDAGRDAGRPDAGRTDAGRPDSGLSDGGPPDAGFDAGTPDAGFDAGMPDAGFDAGMPDAGFDAGMPDAGFDAGTPDAGFDAGTPDAGVDAGTPDAGFDAGTPDAGLVDSGQADGGDAG